MVRAASSLTHTNGDNTAKGQHTDLKAERTVSPNNAQDATGQPTETTDAKAQSTQQLPKPPSAASPEDSPVANVLDPRSPVIKGQGAVSDSSPSTTSATSHTTHSTQKVPSPSVSDLSLVQSQPPDVAAVPSQHQIPVTAKNSKEPTRPDPLGKSTDQDAPITFASDPGLAPSQAAASISSESETSSTTTISTPGSSLGKDSHLPTPSTHPIVTTSIDTTLPQTTTSVPRQPTITVAAMGTNPIQSIIEIKSKTVESGEPHALPKTIAGPQNPNIEPPKNQYDALSPNTSLSSGVSLAGPPPALPASQVVVTRPDSNQIMMSPKDGSQQHKDITQVSSTSSPKGTQPSDKSIITPTNFPPLTSIIPTIYTPFGLLLSRRRKRKKRDLRRTFEIPEKSTYESLNITMHEWEDPNLVRKAVENDVYIKLLKINRYKQEMQKRKKENKKTLIEVHMEVLEEYKNDEWELHKGDFLEICLRGFINEENDFYSNFPNSKLTIKNIKNEKTIEDIQKQEILWNNWIENHRNILEQWKKEEWFHMLKNKWRNEGQMYKDKNDKLQENISNEQETHSIVSQKNIWKQWISKQAALIDMFNKEDWFNSIVYARDKEKNNYHINEYSDISVTSKIGLKNDKSNHEHCKSKNIIQKLLVQIHMMVLEECIKDEIIRNKELRIDNFIEDIHNQNNYDQKRNIPQCDTDNFKVPEFEEIHTSRNK
ncbi:STP1 protein [Plasmodium ovale wallikeri]|uniref:STP1 protein n=1 Tax=Plasmodium ovale wallikeri TaxID=864142 RepID=A0A1A9AMP4_PLAOA|nr:STP1 protein [Plasmodium ovale wallikeri]